jgi:mannitol/fructose-specific phosphotransferase system IIA component (Ntr-type)
MCEPGGRQKVLDTMKITPKAAIPHARDEGL